MVLTCFDHSAWTSWDIPMPQILLECVPAFRLGLTVESLSEVLRLSEAPWRGQNMTETEQSWTERYTMIHGYGSIPIHTIFRGMNIHLPAILMFTRGIGFWPIPTWSSMKGQKIFIAGACYGCHPRWPHLVLPRRQLSSQWAWRRNHLRRRAVIWWVWGRQKTSKRS